MPAYHSSLWSDIIFTLSPIIFMWSIVILSLFIWSSLFAPPV